MNYNDKNIERRLKAYKAKEAERNPIEVSEIMPYQTIDWTKPAPDEVARASFPFPIALRCDCSFGVLFGDCRNFIYRLYQPRRAKRFGDAYTKPNKHGNHNTFTDRNPHANMHRDYYPDLYTHGVKYSNIKPHVYRKPDTYIDDDTHQHTDGDTE